MNPVMVLGLECWLADATNTVDRGRRTGARVHRSQCLLLTSPSTDETRPIRIQGWVDGAHAGMHDDKRRSTSLLFREKRGGERCCCASRSRHLQFARQREKKETGKIRLAFVGSC